MSDHISPTQPALVIDQLSKSFTGNLVLSDFSLSVNPGEVHALLGANGSGKSTLIKVLSGFHTPDPGSTVLVDGQVLESADPDQAYKLGCRFVHQDLGLIETLSVLENLHLTAGYTTRAGTISRRGSAKVAREMLERLELDVDPRAKVATLSAAERTGVAIARAMRPDAQHPPRVLVLDEPTAALPVNEVDRVLALVKAAAASQVAIMYVTHHLREVYRIADTVSVLRDGRTVGRSAVADLSHDALVTLLVGADLEDAHRTDSLQPSSTGAAALTVSGVSGANLDDVSLTVRPGEIVGIAGLDGSGRESILGAIFGAARRTAGTVRVGTEDVVAMRPDRAMRAGAAYLPADRKNRGGAMTMTAQENLTLADLQPLWRRAHLSHRAEKREAVAWFSALGVRPPTAYKQKLGSFSGGNQQKILFSKWLRRNPALLLLDDPTQGVDVGAKVELHKHIIATAERGGAVVVSSTDGDELALLCTRILVFQGGRIVDELHGSRIETNEITRSMMIDRSRIQVPAEGILHG